MLGFSKAFLHQREGSLLVLTGVCATDCGPSLPQVSTLSLSLIFIYALLNLIVSQHVASFLM